MENNYNQQSHENHVASTSARPPFPPGYRFMPTDEELIIEYLFKKVNNKPIPVTEINDVNIYKYSPHYLTENYPRLGDNEWYFFTPRDRKYPNGNRPKRSVEGVGYWKATGADKPIKMNGDTNGELIGKKKVLVFYLGKPKSGGEEKTNWIMHEYKLNTPSKSPNKNNMRLDDWVLCRIYKKPQKPNKKRKDYDDRVNEEEDHDNFLPQLGENINNNNIEDLSALLNIQDNNYDHGPMAAATTTNDNYGDNNRDHQFQAPNYQEDGFNDQLLPNYLISEQVVGPISHDMNYLYDPNNFDYGLMPSYVDEQYILNEGLQGATVWDSKNLDDWMTMGNINGSSFHEQDP